MPKVQPPEKRVHINICVTFHNSSILMLDKEFTCMRGSDAHLVALIKAGSLPRRRQGMASGVCLQEKSV